MAGTDQFCLRWNDFQSNISDAFNELREEKDFFDVTLACDDSSQVEAHKVILSACSPFFRNILKMHPHQHPLLYIKGVKFKEILSILNFMYQGEVNVAQDELSSFLTVAEELKVKGLTRNTSSETGEDTDDQRQGPDRSKNHSRELPENTSSPPSKKARTEIEQTFQNSESEDPYPSPDSIHETAELNIKEEQSDEDCSPVIPAISPPNPQADLKPCTPLMSTPRSSGVGDSFPADETYSYNQFYQEGSGMIQHAGTDANKVKMMSPSKLYGNWTIHHHPGDRVGEEEMGHNTMALENTEAHVQVAQVVNSMAMDSMDSSDCFADPSRDWDSVVAEHMAKRDNIWQCKDCSYMARNKTSVISHVQGKHLEDFTGYVCRICGAKSGTYCGFEKHMSRQHKFSLARKNSVNSILSVKFEEH